MGLGKCSIPGQTGVQETSGELCARRCRTKPIQKLSDYSKPNDIFLLVSNKHTPTANAEAMNIQVVNLADISHLLVKRGREPYRNNALEASLASCEIGGAVKWEEATIPDNLTEPQEIAYKAKMRNRLMVCAKIVNCNFMVTFGSDKVLYAIRKK